MHDSRMRALPKSRQGRACGFVATLAALLLPTTAACAAAVQAQEPAATSSIDRDPAGEVRIEFVKKGLEALELSARLAEGGGLVERPVFWTVRRAGGEIIYQGEQPVADVITEPGDYDVTARYGTVTIARTVALLDEQRLGVSFVLNVGGLRVLPRLGDLRLPAAKSETRVYAISGTARGRMVAISTIPGEIVRLGAGAYRIESRFLPGNATAESQVAIAAGRLAAVEVDMAAGVARLAAGARDEAVTWTIRSATGDMLPPLASARAEIVLSPGRYSAHALIGGRELATEFFIAAGEIKDIVLGN